MFFWATNIVKNCDKEKFVYGSYAIAFDGKGEWSFGNDTTRNIIIFGVNNSSSSHTDNIINDFLTLGEGPTFGIKGRFGASEKDLMLILVKQRQSFTWVWIIIVTIVIYL